MQIKDSKNHKVWEVEEKDGRKKVNLGDSRKNAQGEWDNFTWYGCSLVSTAKELQLQKGDVLTIVSGQMSQYKNKDGKYMPTLTIFEAEVTKQATESASPKFVPVETVEDDDCPF